MSQYQGYTIKLNEQAGRWEIYWRERKLDMDFAREADAEEWIDDQIPSHRARAARVRIRHNRQAQKPHRSRYDGAQIFLAATDS